jgi:hypothetical protein
MSKSDIARFKQIAMRLQATLLQAVGVKLIVGGDTFEDLPGLLAELITKGLAKHV